jgi:hypothetical protein
MRSSPVLVATGLLLALAGCTPTSHATSAPTPSATPVFASDAAALEAAEAAYAAYLKVSDQIANDGGKDPERIAKYVTAERLSIELRGSTSLENHGLRTTGSTTFSNASLEQSTFSVANTTIAFYACWSVADVRVLNVVGDDVTPANRVNSKTLEIVMTTKSGRLPLVLESDEPWSASSFC